VELWVNQAYCMPYVIQTLPRLSEKSCSNHADTEPPVVVLESGYHGHEKLRAASLQPAPYTRRNTVTKKKQAWKPTITKRRKLTRVLLDSPRCALRRKSAEVLCPVCPGPVKKINKRSKKKEKKKKRKKSPNSDVPPSPVHARSVSIPSLRRRGNVIREPMKRSYMVFRRPLTKADDVMTTLDHSGVRLGSTRSPSDT